MLNKHLFLHNTAVTLLAAVKCLNCANVLKKAVTDRPGCGGMEPTAVHFAEKVNNHLKTRWEKISMFFFFHNHQVRVVTGQVLLMKCTRLTYHREVCLHFHQNKKFGQFGFWSTQVCFYIMPRGHQPWPQRNDWCCSVILEKLKGLKTQF